MRLAMFSVVSVTPLLMIKVCVLLVFLALLRFRGAKRVEAGHNVASSSCESSCNG